MDSNSKLVVAAKRAARNLSHQSSATYQQCLDLVAQTAGRRTWADFVARPVPINEAATFAAAEPDFKALSPEAHLTAILSYAEAVHAIGFECSAEPKAQLVFDTPRGPYPIDARGIDVTAIAASLEAAHDFTNRLGRYARVNEARIIYAAHPETQNAHQIAATFDGAPAIHHNIPISNSTAASQETPAEQQPPRVPHNNARKWASRPLARVAESFGVGANNQAIKAAIKQRILTADNDGILIGKSEAGAPLRCVKHANILAFSPPGTGRMAGISIPAILTSDMQSFIVHDDGQLHKITSGHRAAVGHVAVIRIHEDGTETINPFGAEWMPTDIRGRVNYTNLICEALASDHPELVRPLRLAALDLIAQHGETTVAAIYEHLKASAQSQEERAACVHIAPLRRAYAAKTMRSTILPSHLRGTQKDGRARPFTLYLIHDPRGSTRDPLIAAIQHAIWSYAISWGPGEDIPKRGTLGPTPLTVLFHDFQRTPRLSALPIAMDFGRAKSLSTIIGGSTATSLTKNYSADEVMVIRSLAYAWIIPTQSDYRESELIDPTGLVGYEAMRDIPEGNALLAWSQDHPPIRMQLAAFFKDPKILERAWNERTRRGPQPVG